MAYQSYLRTNFIPFRPDTLVQAQTNTLVQTNSHTNADSQLNQHPNCRVFQNVCIDGGMMTKQVSFAQSEGMSLDVYPSIYTNQLNLADKTRSEYSTQNFTIGDIQDQRGKRKIVQSIENGSYRCYASDSVNAYHDNVLLLSHVDNTRVRLTIDNHHHNHNHNYNHNHQS